MAEQKWQRTPSSSDDDTVSIPERHNVTEKQRVKDSRRGRVCQLEKAFHIAFGSDKLGKDSKETMLYPAGRAVRVVVTISDSTGESNCSPLMLEGTCGVTVHDSLAQPRFKWQSCHSDPE